MMKRKRMTARAVRRGLALVAAALLAGCAPSNLERRYDGMLAELRRSAPAPPVGREPDRGAGVGGVTRDGTTLFAGAQHLARAAVVEAVLARNPDVEAARRAWRAAVARVPQATALEDPMLSYEIAPLSASGDGSFGQRVELGQRLPFPGKRRLAGEVALAEAEAAGGGLDQVRLDLALMASNLHDDLYVAAHAIDVNHHHKELLEQLKESAAAQYTAGRASQQDPLQAEVALLRLEEDAFLLEAEQSALVAQLNGLLHRPPDAPLPPPEIELADLRDAPEPPAALEREALTNRPELRAKAAIVRGARASIGAARREYYPDLELMGSYDSMWDTQEHRWMVGIGLNIPLQMGRRRAAVDRAEADWARARSEDEGVRDRIRVEVAQAEARARGAAQVVRLIESRLLPAARDQVDAALAGFRAGQNPFAAVVEAEKNLREVELMRHQALADLARGLAARDRALGRIPGLSRGGPR